MPLSQTSSPLGPFLTCGKFSSTDQNASLGGKFQIPDGYEMSRLWSCSATSSWSYSSRCVAGGMTKRAVKGDQSGFGGAGCRREPGQAHIFVFLIVTIGLADRTLNVSSSPSPLFQPEAKGVNYATFCMAPARGFD
jgi:hypothetical protein